MENSISLSELSFDDQINHVSDTIKHKWIASYPYKKEHAISFISKEPTTLLDDSIFRIHLLYVNMLYRSLTNKKTVIKDEETLNEVSYWNKEGGLCIYLSVLMYALLLNEKITNRHNLRYIQGFTTFEVTNPLWKLIAPQTNALNFHAWLSYKGSVLDFSIDQESAWFDLGDKEYLLGDIPNGMTMIGFKESDKTVQKYVEMFAKQRKLSDSEWIKAHKQNSFLCTKNAFQFLMDDE